MKPVIGFSSGVVHTGEYGADVDLLAGFDVEFDEHTVAGRGHGVLHLHGFQPDQRLARGDGVADAAPMRAPNPAWAPAANRARPRRRDPEARQRDELHRAERGVDEHVVAVAGDVERAVHAVDGQTTWSGSADTRVTASKSGTSTPCG